MNQAICLIYALAMLIGCAHMNPLGGAKQQSNDLADRHARNREVLEALLASAINQRNNDETTTTDDSLETDDSELAVRDNFNSANSDELEYDDDSDRFVSKKAAGPRRMFIGKRPSSGSYYDDYVVEKRDLFGGKRQNKYLTGGKRNGQIHRIFIGKRGDIKRIFIG